MAKEIERSGIPVAYVTTLTSLAEEIRANRIVAGVRIPHPVGNPSLTPDNERILRTAVTWTSWSGPGPLWMTRALR